MNKLTEEQKQMIKELKDVDYFAVETDPVVNELVNAFIKEAVPNLFPHYVDNDENAGQKLRVQLDSLLQKEREAGKREGIEEAILEVKELEIRSDDGGDYITSDTELMRTEAVEALLELKSNSLQEKLEIDDFKFDKKGNSIP